MANYREFTINECFYHEETTRKHTLKYNRELTIYELIKLGIEADNYDYINYLIFKRMHLIKTIILNETRNTNFKLELDQYEDIVLDDPEYESLLNYYAKTFNNNTDNNTINIEDLIKVVVSFNHWFMLYYIYFKERNDLSTFLYDEDEKYCEYQRKLQRERKFYIFQM